MISRRVPSPLNENEILRSIPAEENSRAGAFRTIPSELDDR